MRVAQADDSVLFRRGLGLLLEQAGITVVASVGSGPELEQILDPADVAVLDIRMPPTFTDEGLATAERLRRTFPGLGILVLSTYVEATYAIRLLRHGGHGVGYLLKDRVDDVDALVDALRRVAQGASVVDPDVMERLVRQPARRRVESLSPRELEVLALVAQGRSNASIGRELHLQEKTVEGHVASTFIKLGLLPAVDSNRRVLAVLEYLSA